MSCVYVSWPTYNNKKQKVHRKFLISSRKPLLLVAVFLFSQKLSASVTLPLTGIPLLFRGTVVNKCLLLFICLPRNLMCQRDRPSCPAGHHATPRYSHAPLVEANRKRHMWNADLVGCSPFRASGSCSFCRRSSLVLRHPFFFKSLRRTLRRVPSPLTFLVSCYFFFFSFLKCSRKLQPISQVNEQAYRTLQSSIKPSRSY